MKFFTKAPFYPTTAPSDAIREQKKNILENLFSSVLSKFKKFLSSVKLLFDDLCVFQSLKLCNLMEKILRISLKLNFSPNTLGCYGLTEKTY